MWIKLISPKVTMRPMDSAFKRQMAPPLSLLVLGALTPDQHRVTITDENVEPLDLSDTPDLVGITVKADTAGRSQEVAQAYRARRIPVVVGGIYPTTCPDDCTDLADALVIGEAEEIWGTLLQDVEAGCLKKIYRNESPPDLSLSPIPRWDLIAEKHYLYPNTLTIGRGCPWRCSFCYNSSSNLPSGYRMKPISAILDEITSLNTRHVLFIDDNFIADKTFARRLIMEFQSLGIVWHTAVSADIGKHDDILDSMATSGCRSLFIGLETLNADNLKGAGKRQNLVKEYSRTIAKIHDRGMMVNASIVFGFDGDRPDVFGTTTDWLIDQKVETMTAHILTPYPGTVLHTKLRAQGRIIDQDLTHYNTSRAVFRPAQMSTADLEQGYIEAYRHFYSWSSILHRLPVDSRRSAPYLLFNVFYRKYGGLVSSLGTIGLMRAIGKLGARISYPAVNRRPAPAKYRNRDAINSLERASIQSE
jgi:radical SAM superfamily enzyme YgiQ (UPF0313 family)